MGEEGEEGWGIGARGPSEVVYGGWHGGMRKGVFRGVGMYIKAVLLLS